MVENKLVALQSDSAYSFTLSPEEALKPVTSRFVLRFRRPVVAATTSPWSRAGNVGVYLNPAHQQVSVWVPSVPGASQVHATLLNGLGQVVRQQLGALPAAGTTLRLNVQSLASGVYILRLQAGPATVTRRVIVE